jgi:hypothetical protein
MKRFARRQVSLRFREAPICRALVTCAGRQMRASLGRRMIRRNRVSHDDEGSPAQSVDEMSEQEAADAPDYIVSRGRDPLARRLDAAPAR